MTEETKGVKDDLFCFLMDSKGTVCGLAGENNNFSVDIGSFWQDLWPEPELAGRNILKICMGITGNG